MIESPPIISLALKTYLFYNLTMETGSYGGC
jgi:hypothetical protein